MRFLSKRGLTRPLIPIAYAVLSIVGYAAVNRYVEAPAWRWGAFGLMAVMGLPVPIALETAKHFGLDQV